MTNIDISVFQESYQFEVSSYSIDEFPVAMREIAEQHRPSRMPFFQNLARLDGMIATDPNFSWADPFDLSVGNARHSGRSLLFAVP